MFNKKLLAASMAAAISTGIATQANAMMMQENNLGEVLLAPLYITGGEAGSQLNTEITVVNTRTDAAVKAKIVFRESINSSEVLDFILYLSPGDVWRGTVTGATNAAVMESTDDSMTDNSGTFGSADNPIAQPFFDKESSGSNGFGHFEVFGVYTTTVGTTSVTAVSNPSTTVNVAQGMDKRDLKALFDAVSAAGLPAGVGMNGTGGTSVLSANNPMYKQLMGEVQLVVGDTALTNYEVPALGHDANGQVIANPAYDAGVGNDSLIGFGWGPNGEDLIGEVEAAIASTDTAFEYNVDGDNITAPVIAFVTKYRHREDIVGVSGCTPGTQVPNSSPAVTLNYSAPFEDTVIGEIIYTMTSYDNSENSETIIEGQFSGGTITPQSLPYEVNILAPTYYSTSGWADIRWLPSSGRTCMYYNGVPALNATLKTKGGNFLWTENGDRRSHVN